MGNRRKTLIFLTVLWPVMLMVITFVRFGLSMLGNALSSPLSFLFGLLVFALIGWLSGLLLFVFIKPGKFSGNLGAMVGYALVAVPAAWFAILGGLLFPVIGQALYGLSVLGIGIVVGWMVGLLSGRITQRFRA